MCLKTEAGKLQWTSKKTSKCSLLKSLLVKCTAEEVWSFWYYLHLMFLCPSKQSNPHLSDIITHVRASLTCCLVALRLISAGWWSHRNGRLKTQMMETSTHLPSLLPSETRHQWGVTLCIISSVTISKQHKNKPQPLQCYHVNNSFFFLFITKTAYIKHLAKGMQRC